MKFIKALNLWEQETLEQMRDKHELSITRKRAHSILLSNVLGFINHSCQFESYVFEQPFNSSMVVACFDEFVKTIDKTTYVLIDNAPTHTSHLFKESIKRWEQSNLYVKFISSYSPDLNLIEILWRKIKYDWIPFSAFQSFNYLKSDLFHILANIGSDEYTITYI